MGRPGKFSALLWLFHCTLSAMEIFSELNQCFQVFLRVAAEEEAVEEEEDEVCKYQSQMYLVVSCTMQLANIRSRFSIFSPITDIINNNVTLMVLTLDLQM